MQLTFSPYGDLHDLKQLTVSTCKGFVEGYICFVLFWGALNSKLWNSYVNRATLVLISEASNRVIYAAPFSLEKGYQGL